MICWARSLHPRNKNMIKIQKLINTCESCPAQWEGKTDEGKMVYIRYRWGNLSVRISAEQSNDIYEAVGGIEIFNQQLNDNLHGWLSYEELKTITADIIKFPPIAATTELTWTELTWDETHAS